MKTCTIPMCVQSSIQLTTCMLQLTAWYIYYYRLKCYEWLEGGESTIKEGGGARGKKGGL